MSTDSAFCPNNNVCQATDPAKGSRWLVAVQAPTIAHSISQLPSQRKTKVRNLCSWLAVMTVYSQTVPNGKK